MTVTLTASLADLTEDLRQASAYTGAKMTGDEQAYDRITATRADTPLLVKTYHSLRSDITTALRRFLVSENLSADDNTWTLTLHLSTLADQDLTASMRQALHNTLLQGLLAAWYTYTNKPEAAAAATAAAAALDELRRACLHKTPPTRPTYQ